MKLSKEFGLKQSGTLAVAMDWARSLDRAIELWAPTYSESDQRMFPYWIGSGVVSVSESTSEADDRWTAVAIMESKLPMRRKDFRPFWNRAPQFMADRGASFAALIVGPIIIAAGAVSIGGSVRVPGGLSGTLGGAVAHGNTSFALTAGHVASSGPRIAGEPTVALGVNEEEIGHVVGWSELRAKRNTTDLGLINLHPGYDDGGRSVLGAYTPEQLRRLRVRKTGAGTKTTVGTVTLLGTKNIPVIHGDGRKYFDGLIGIEADEPFAKRGDSGALVFPADDTSDAKAIGMIVAASELGTRGGSGQPVGWAVPAETMSANIGSILRGRTRGTEA